MTILTSPIFIPKEILVDILSFLPVNSLLRFKCVCKLWNTITLDFQFACLHFKRSPFLIYKKPPSTATGKDEFVRSYPSGLLPEHITTGSHSPLRYRIRNPETRQILELPDSHNKILRMHVVIDPNNQVLKLVSIVREVGKSALGYEVLDLRNDQSAYSWRPLNNVIPVLPEKSVSGQTGKMNQITTFRRQITKEIFKQFLLKQIVVRIAVGAVYCIWDSSVAPSYIEIDILDMVNDSYIGKTTFPGSFYSKDDCMIWRGKLSFAKIVKEELHVLVLEDYRKQIKWAEEKLIIKLTFLKELAMPHELQITVLAVRKSMLYFRWVDKDSICTYDFTTGKVTTIVSGYNGSQGLCVTRSCLFTFKGMQLSS